MSVRRDYEELVAITKTYDLILWSCNHTGKWWEVHQGLTLDKCLKTIRQDPTFQP
jgi:hypothetical protein